MKLLRIPTPLRVMLLAATLLIAVPAVATAVSTDGSAKVPDNVHLVRGQRPSPEVVAATRSVEASPIIGCGPWGHPNCIMDQHPPGQYFQPLCSCDNGPAFNCCNGPNQPCA